MRKSIILCTLAAIVAFGAGYLTCQKVNGDIIYIQKAALYQAEKVMDNNDLWDIDGSDDMVQYMELAEKADSLYNNYK